MLGMLLFIHLSQTWNQLWQNIQFNTELFFILEASRCVYRRVALMNNPLIENHLRLSANKSAALCEKNIGGLILIILTNPALSSENK